MGEAMRPGGRADLPEAPPALRVIRAQASKSPGTEARLVGEHDRLDAVAQAELGEHVADVGLDRGLRDDSSSAISVLDRPRAISRSTSSSRSVSSSSAGGRPASAAGAAT